MLFQVRWAMYEKAKMDAMKFFAKMNPEDDAKDAGSSIKIIGRWHSVGADGTGVCICESDNVEALNAWMLNWAPMCDIKVIPVIDDESARKVLRTKFN